MGTKLFDESGSTKARSDSSIMKQVCGLSSMSDNKVFLTGDWAMGKSLTDAWKAGLKLSHYIKILDI